jgi:hypothetical protein
MQALQEQKPAVKKSELIKAPYLVESKSVFSFVAVCIHVKSRLFFQSKWLLTSQVINS